MTDGPAIDPQARLRIENTLATIESEHDVTILYACESGSRGWGFASPDSDYDVRFIYVHPPAWYLTVTPGKDVIELPPDPVYDINGWDLRKALYLIRKGNVIVMEWLSSPIVYRENPDFMIALRGALGQVYAPGRSFHHYLHMGKKNYRQILNKEPVRLKKYIYSLRPLLACLWVEQALGPAPMRFQTLVEKLITDPALRADIDELLRIKRQASESEYGTPIPGINAFLDREFARLEQISPPRSEIPPDFAVLDRLLYEAVWQREART